MVNKYSAKLSGLKRVNWAKKSQKQQANYFKKAYEELNLLVPQYIENGTMTGKQLESNINKLTKSLQSRAKKESKQIKSVNKKAETVLKQMKREYQNYINSLPTEYKNSKVFMNYFTKGHGLKTSSHNIDGYGPDYTVLDTIKEMKKYYQENNTKKLIEIMKYQIDEMKNNLYVKQINRLKNKALTEIDRLEQELNDGMYSPNSNALKKVLNSNQIPYHELLELTKLLENNGNIFDSVYNNNKLGGGQEDFNLTIKKMYDISKRYNLKDYMN